MNHISQAIRVLIVEDQEVARLGVSLLLQNCANIQVIAAVASLAEALLMGVHLQPDVILLDLYLQEGLIVQRIPELLALSSQPKILVFTASNQDHPLHLQALQTGASGLVTKSQSLDTLVKAINAVYQGERWLEPEIAAWLIKALRQTESAREAEPVLGSTVDEDSGLPELSCREASVAYLARKGWPAKKIAQHLSISEKTVRNNLTVIYQKFAVSNQVEFCLKTAALDFGTGELPTSE